MKKFQNICLIKKIGKKNSQSECRITLKQTFFQTFKKAIIKQRRDKKRSIFFLFKYRALFHKDPDGKDDDYHHPNLRSSKLSLSAPTTTTTSGLLGNFEVCNSIFWISMIH